MSVENSDEILLAQQDFEKHFGVSDDLATSTDYLGGEKVIVVENHIKRAFYSLSAELIKVINLTGEE